MLLHKVKFLALILTRIIENPQSNFLKPIVLFSFCQGWNDKILRCKAGDQVRIFLPTLHCFFAHLLVFVPTLFCFYAYCFFSFSSLTYTLCLLFLLNCLAAYFISGNPRQFLGFCLSFSLLSLLTYFPSYRTYNIPFLYHVSSFHLSFFFPTLLFCFSANFCPYYVFDSTTLYCRVYVRIVNNLNYCKKYKRSSVKYWFKGEDNCVDLDTSDDNDHDDDITVIMMMLMVTSFGWIHDMHSDEKDLKAVEKLTIIDEHWKKTTLFCCHPTPSMQIFPFVGFPKYFPKLKQNVWSRRDLRRPSRISRNLLTASL